MVFGRKNRKDQERHELAAANRLRSLGTVNTYQDADPEEVNRRLRNMSYGSRNSRIAAVRG